MPPPPRRISRWLPLRSYAAAEARREDERRPTVVLLRVDARAGRDEPVLAVADVRHHAADSSVAARPEHLSGDRIERALVVARARRHGARRADGPIEHGRVGRIELGRQELCGKAVVIVLRRHVDHTQAVVERQPRVHLPVVLQEELEIAVEVLALDVAARLLVLIEDAKRGVREAERRVERVGRRLAEVHRTAIVRTRILRLVGVFVEHAGLGRVPAHDPGRAHVDVVDEVAREAAATRRDAGVVAAAIAERERRRNLELAIAEERRRVRAEARQLAVGVEARFQEPGVREQHRERGQPGRVVDVARRGDGGRRDVVQEVPVGGFEKRRGIHRVVDRGRELGLERHPVDHVVEPVEQPVVPDAEAPLRERPVGHLRGVLPDHLARQAQRLRIW